VRGVRRARSGLERRRLPPGAPSGGADAGVENRLDDPAWLAAATRTKAILGSK